MWIELQTNSKTVGVAVSDDGSTIVCGMGTGTTLILDSNLRTQKGLSISNIANIAMTPDGEYFVCGTGRGEIYYFDTTGEQIWSLDVGDNVRDILISSDGNLVAALTGSILLFDSSRNELQELKLSETIQRMDLSKSGGILSYTSNKNLFFLELFQRSKVWTYEYMLPSRKSIPLDDQLTEVWSYEGTPHSVTTADINGDRQNEIICSFAKEIVVLNSEGKVLWKKTFSFLPQVSVMDLDKDFVPEVIVKSDDRRMGLYIFDGKGKELVRHEFYSRWYAQPPPQGYDLGILPLWSDDIDGDDSIEVICQLHAGYAVNPRGFYAFEYPSFEEEWYYPVASTLATIHFVDIDGDGQVEIVAGSEAPCNGRQLGGTDDCHAYVYAVTLQGKGLWTKQIGPGGYKRIYIAVVDSNNDGNMEIVCAGWSFEDNWGTLFILDSEGNYTAGEGNEFDHSVFLESVADMDNDGTMEILTSLSPSTLVLYDRRLREVKRKDVSITLSPSTRVLVNDIDADGKKEMILTSDDEKLLILNTDLEEEWSKTFPSYDKYLKAAVVNLDGCKNLLLVLSDKVYAYTYTHNPDQPCVPWIIAKQGKIAEIESSLEEARKYLEQGDMARAAEYVSQAEEAYMSIGTEGGLEEYYKEIEEMRKAIDASLTETPGPTLSTETLAPTSTPPVTSSPSGILGSLSPLDIIYLVAAILTILTSIKAVPEIIRRIKAYRKKKGKEEDHAWKTEIQEEPEIKALYEYDVFICYASEDKESFVRGLAEALDNKGLRVWYDEFMLTLGDKLTEKIDYGLSRSRYGVVVLSKNFFTKDWTKKELDALAAREKGKTKVILPIWYGVTREEVQSFSPKLADRLAVSSDKGIDHVIDEIFKVFENEASKPSEQKQP